MINLNVFLDKESGSDLYNRPHRVSRNIVCYCNGAILIKSKEKIKPGMKVDASPEIIEFITRTEIEAKSYKPLPQYAPQEVKTCEDCKGSGYIKYCPECNGEGRLEFKNNHNTYYPECKTCNGLEFIPAKKAENYSQLCESCDGDGKYNYWGDDYNDKLINIGGSLFDKNLLEKLKMLPLLAIQVTDPKNDFLRFSFFGGKGILMRVT